MEFVTFTLVGIGIYFGADAILEAIERTRGARFGASRQVVFFVIFLAMALPAFALIRALQGPG